MILGHCRGVTTVPEVHEQIAFSPHLDAPAVLTDDVTAFLAELHHRFEPARQKLLTGHHDNAKARQTGTRPDFDPSTNRLRSSDWHIAPAPRDLVNRRTELVGLVSPRALLEGLNSGAQVYMADFEDSATPVWSTTLTGQRSIQDFYADRLHVEIDGVAHIPLQNHATLMVRTRGWHLDEPNFRVHNTPISASLFDFGVCVANNANASLKKGTSLYFYLPKFEGAADAELWSDVLTWSEERLGLAPGTIRVSVLIETIGAAFAMDEILFALRDHITALHAGIWDYLFSFVKTFSTDRAMLLPDLDALGPTTPFIRAFNELLVSTCHRRGAHAIGGMSGVIPDQIDPTRTAPMVRRVTTDKRREAGDGFDGTRLAQAATLPLAQREFDRVLSYRANQLEVQRDDVYITASDLLTIHTSQGRCTETGLRRAIRSAMHYIGFWLTGVGAVPIDDHLEDAAMAELSRAQLWQWRHHEIELTSGVTVSSELVDRLFREETASLRASLGEVVWAQGRFDRAAELLRTWTEHDTLLPFFTVATSPELATPSDDPSHEISH